MTFPASPTSGQQATEGGRLFAWNGSNAWELVANVTGHAASHASGGADAVSIAASQITAGTVATARLGSGTADSTTYLRGDQTWATVAGGGSSSASDLTSGTLADARLSANVVLTTDSRLASGYGRILLFG